MRFTKKCIVGLLALCCAAPLFALDQQGVAVSDNATPAEKRAADVLIKYLNRITGKEFRLAAVKDARFLVGSEFVADPALGNDGLAIISKDGQVRLGGGTSNGRGNCHAVYEYLEQCGVRFWTKTEEDIPELASEKLPMVNTRQVPSFPLIRYIIANFVQPAYEKWKLNGCVSGHWTKGYGSKSLRKPEAGIVPDYQPYNWHTLLFFLPQKKYGKKHPEWYALYQGKRDWNVKRGQLCFSNREMTKEFIANCREYLKKYGGLNTILGVTREDRDFVNCECENCKKDDASIGQTPGGAYFLFLNRVAEGLEKDFPDMRIHGSFGTSIKQPPTAPVKLHRNIFVSTGKGGDLASGITDSEEGRAYYAVLKKWSEISPGGTDVCDYGSTFDNYLFPLPNFDGLAGRLRDWRDAHVVGMTTINAHSGGGGGELHELRSYLTAKLYWNCDLDPWQIAKEFCDGYYKAAGKHIFGYVKWYHDHLRKEKKYTYRMGRNPAFAYDRKYVDKAMEFFRKAYAAAGDDPTVKTRLDHAFISIRFLDLEVRHAAGEVSKKFDDDVLTFEKECARFKITMLSESRRLKDYLGGLKLKVPTPPFCKDLKRSDWFVHLPSCYPYWGWCKITDDPTSPSKRPVELNMHHDAWAVYKKCSVLPGSVLQDGHYDAYVYLRPELARPDVPATAPVCKFGWLDGNQRQYGQVTLQQLPAGKYGYVKIASNFIASLDGYVWLAPLKNEKNIKNVYVDHMIFVRKD